MPLDRVKIAVLRVASALALGSLVGCAAPLVPSQQLHLTRPIKGHVRPRHKHFNPAGTVCTDRQRLVDALPYVAGPFLPDHAAAGDSAVLPPHSKFHPVPTQPVFAPRDDYAPPQPIGPHLIPIPEHTAEHYFTRPYEKPSTSNLELPPTP